MNYLYLCNCKRRRTLKYPGVQEGAYLDFQKVISLKPKEIPPEYTTPGGSPRKQAKLLIHSSLAYFFPRNCLQIVCKIHNIGVKPKYFDFRSLQGFLLALYHRVHSQFSSMLFRMHPVKLMEHHEAQNILRL